MRPRSCLLLVLLLGICGCSSRSGYDMLRLNQEQRCLELQGADRERCQQQAGMSYDEYQRQLNKRNESR